MNLRIEKMHQILERIWDLRKLRDQLKLAESIS